MGRRAEGKERMTRLSTQPHFTRRVNDSIHQVLDKLAAEDGEFWCECDDMHCQERVLLTLREYAALRERGHERLLAPVHQPNSTLIHSAFQANTYPSTRD
jgi:hypothetical protein